MEDSVESLDEPEINKILCSPFTHWLHLFVSEDFKVGQAEFPLCKPMLTTCYHHLFVCFQEDLKWFSRGFAPSHSQRLR